MKLTSLILSLLLSATVVGCTTSADADAWKQNTGTINLTEKTVTGNGIEFKDNMFKITKGGDFEVKGEIKDSMIYVNTEEKVKLRLSGASISNSNGPAIFFDNTEKGFITITKDTKNYLTDGKEYSVEAKSTLFSNDDLEIKGEGYLSITSLAKHAIASDDDLKIENGTIEIASYEHGLKANNTIEISGGSITITAETGKGIKAEEELIVNDGTINIKKSDEGMESKGKMTINGGKISICSTDDGLNTGNSSTEETTTETTANTSSDMPQGGEMPQMPDGEMPLGERPQRGQMPNGEMPQGTPPEMPQGGERPQMPEGEAPQNPQGGTPQGGGGFGGRLDEETAAAHALTINGGEIYINAGADGIDSNGNLTINGGKVIIYGPLSSGNSSIDTDGTITVNGGILAALSGVGMVQTPVSTSEQCFITASFSQLKTAGTVLTVKDSDGKEIMTITPEKDYQLLIFSSPDLEEGKEYSVYAGETLESTVTAGKSAMNTGGFGGGGGRGKDRGNFGNAPVQ